MKRSILVMTILLSYALTACTPDSGEAAPGPRPPVENPEDRPNSGDDPESGPGGGGNPGGGNENGGGEDNPPAESRVMRIAVGSETFEAEFAATDAAEVFRAMLPMNVRMGDLNANEKYYYLPDDLPSSAANPGTIQAGDIMLFGRSCLVVFYKTFSSSYSYTRIATIGNPAGLERALGTGDVVVTFELEPKLK